MKISTIPLFIFLAFTACVQPTKTETKTQTETATPTPKPKKQLVINNELTAAHQKFEGTPVYIIPPPGFKPLAGLPIFELDRGNMIDITYQKHQIPHHFNDDKIREQSGINLNEYEIISFNGRKAKIFLVGNMYNFFTGDSTFSLSAGGLFPEGDLAAKARIKEALLTMYWE